MAKNKKKTIKADPFEEKIREANRRHDSEISKDDARAWKKTNNKFYEKAECDIDRTNLGTGWNNRWQDSFNARSKNAEDAILKNQINIKKNRKPNDKTKP